MAVEWIYRGGRRFAGWNYNCKANSTWPLPQSMNSFTQRANPFQFVSNKTVPFGHEVSTHVHKKNIRSIFKKVLIPCAAGVSSVPNNNEGHTFGQNCTKKAETGTKPSDLPIYSKECAKCREDNQPPPSPSGMEETVGNIRRELWVWQDNLKGYRHKIIDVYRKGFSKGDSVVEYLRQPSHGPHRIAAIAISGLAGYILGMRRGRFRRVFYGTVGAVGMAAICYPEEAKEVLESAVLEARRYFIVAYHFVYGESPNMPEWLEKFVGPKEAEPETIGAISESKKITNDEKKQPTHAKTA